MYLSNGPSRANNSLINLFRISKDRFFLFFSKLNRTNSQARRDIPSLNDVFLWLVLNIASFGMVMSLALVALLWKEDPPIFTPFFVSVESTTLVPISKLS